MEPSEWYLIYVSYDDAFRSWTTKQFCIVQESIPNGFKRFLETCLSLEQAETRLQEMAEKNGWKELLSN